LIVTKGLKRRRRRRRRYNKKNENRNEQTKATGYRLPVE
jgi:hypothetical protein